MRVLGDLFEQTATTFLASQLARKVVDHWKTKIPVEGRVGGIKFCSDDEVHVNFLSHLQRKGHFQLTKG